MKSHIFVILCALLIKCQGQNQNFPPQDNGIVIQANQMDFSAWLTDILLNGLLRGATSERQQLLSAPELAGAIRSFRDSLNQVIDYNLNAMQNISLIVERCVIQPRLNSRQALETARDSAFDCLQGLRNNPGATNQYQSCLREVLASATRNIDALKPSIDACLATVTTTTLSTLDAI